MTWLTKNLTLDLLAITIDGLSRAFDRIKDEPDTVDPATAHPADYTLTNITETPAAPGPVVDPEPAVDPEPQPAPAPEAPASQPDPAPAEDLLPEAQHQLRTIAQGGNVEWITRTLFPHFGVTSLTDVPADRLPELISMAKTKNQEAA